MLMILKDLTPVVRRLIRQVLLLAAATAFAWGSGSYVVRSIRPPVRMVEESQKYELGKSVFLGKATIKEKAGPDRAAQQERLSELQIRLPPRVKKSVNLPDLAGKLSLEQFLALQHFIRVRHKVE